MQTKLPTANRQQPTILITGARGQLGQKLAVSLRDRFRLVLTDKDKLDITVAKNVNDFVKQMKPDFIIHAAAFTNVDGAETNMNLCDKINRIGTENIARAAAKINASTIYISTDYVFDGKKRSPYRETDIARPISVYGKSKLDGEKAIVKSCRRYYILRLAWLFGQWSGRMNFVETMIGLARNGTPLRVVDDQIGSPTYTGDVADIIEKLIVQKPPCGIYHFSGKGKVSKFGQVKEIFAQMKIDANLKPCKSHDFPTAAHRPAYSYLDKTKIEKALKIKVRPWQKMLAEYLSQRVSS